MFGTSLSPLNPYTNLLSGYSTKSCRFKSYLRNQYDQTNTAINLDVGFLSFGNLNNFFPQFHYNKNGNFQAHLHMA